MLGVLVLASTLLRDLAGVGAGAELVTRGRFLPTTLSFLQLGAGAVLGSTPVRNCGEHSGSGAFRGRGFALPTAFFSGWARTFGSRRDRPMRAEVSDLVAPPRRSIARIAL